MNAAAARKAQTQEVALHIDGLREALLKNPSDADKARIQAEIQTCYTLLADANQESEQKLKDALQTLFVQDPETRAVFEGYLLDFFSISPKDAQPLITYLLK